MASISPTPARKPQVGSVQKLHAQDGHVVGAEVVAVGTDAHKLEVAADVGLEAEAALGRGVEDGSALAVLQDIGALVVDDAAGVDEPAGRAGDPVGRRVLTGARAGRGRGLTGELRLEDLGTAERLPGPLGIALEVLGA